MPFNSLKYFLFLPLVYLVFYAAGERVRWMVLLAASLLFYAALKVPYLPAVMTLVALATYAFGIWLERVESAQAKRAVLWSGVATNVLILVGMKYLPFLSENVKALATALSIDTPLQPVTAFVSIGVSYYVFQAISYLFDIYLEIEKPERHFGYFALYLALFPKLLQGPIERASDLLPQLKSRYEFNYDNMRFGLLLFTWGLFKKLSLPTVSVCMWIRSITMSMPLPVCRCCWPPMPMPSRSTWTFPVTPTWRWEVPAFSTST